jgi:uncharacterized protein (DUF2062 family)
VSDEEFKSLVTLAVTVIDVALALAAVLSTIYIVHVYRQRKEEALFLTRLVHRDIRVGIGGGIIVAYIALAYSGYTLGAPWGGLIVSLAVGLMLIGPIDDAIQWFRERRKPEQRQRKTVPPGYDMKNDSDGFYQDGT